jgi:hypothetical protein
MIKLEWLNMQNNQIESIESLSKMDDLQVLDLRNNFIKSIEPLKNATFLERIYLSENRIQNIDAAGNWPCMQEIDVSNNYILESADWLKQVQFNFIYAMCNVQFLYLKNKIKKVKCIETWYLRKRHFDFDR